MLILAVDVPRKHEVSLIAEPYMVKEIWVIFNFVLKPVAHLNTFLHVSCCKFVLHLYSVRIQMKVLSKDRVMKVCGSVFEQSYRI